MILVFDIGNTRVKCGLFENGKLTSLKILDDEKSIISFINETNFEDSCICSVSSTMTELISKTIRDKSRNNPFIISVNNKTNIKIKYNTPGTLGMDRICSLEGALLLVEEKTISDKSKFVITMDCGTATTLNVLQLPNIFLGGTISPGIKLMFDSLHKNTSQLPQLNVKDYSTIIGKSTSASIASGVVNSTIGLLDKVIKELKELYGAEEIVLYITGGNAESILPFIKYKYEFEKALVIYGAYSLYKLNSL
jgi:type III pantothenate kinase